MSETLVTIPLNQLKRSSLNVRKTEALKDIEQMAASIESQGLLENLVVRRVAGKHKPPIYEVIAGARRLAALNLLTKRKRIAREYPVPCRVLDKTGDADAIEVSLAENIVRAPMHPADQFDAFAKLQEEGLSADDIAARFGLASTIVRQRLKLAAVSPRLIAVYRDGEMDLEQLMAFAISDDREAQEQFWFELSPYDRSAAAIRGYLMRTHVEGADRRARFIGVKAYEAAGGAVVRDLFHSEHEGFFADSQLLDRLVVEKLNAEAEAIKAEGWGWVEIQTVLDHDYLSRFGRIKAIDVQLSRKEERRLTTLCGRYDELVSQMDDEVDESVAKELDLVSTELDALRFKKEAWPAGEKAKAGVLVSLEYDGALRVMRGLVRQTGTGDGRGTKGGTKPRPVDGHSESLLVELSAQRTAVLREILAGRPETALTALLHTLVSDVFFGRSSSCLEVGVTVTSLTRFSKLVDQGKASVALHERHERWQESLPTQEALWSWLKAAEPEVRLNLLAYCAAMSIDGVYRTTEQSRIESADRLAIALGLDMADWWRPTSTGYFDHISKDQIMRVVAEGSSPEAAQRLRDLKKPDMSKAAEGLLAETRWVPRPLNAVPGDAANDGVMTTAAE